MSALPPDGAVFLYYEQNQAMMAALLPRVRPGARPGCAGRRPRRHRDPHWRSALTPDGTPWVSVAQCGGEIGPFGANAYGDADSQMLSYLANGIAVAAEAVEAEVPVVVLRHEIVADSGGAGYNRGGASVVRDSLWLAPAAHSLMTLRAKEAAGFGVNGGGDGKTGGVWVYEPGADGSATEPGARPGLVPRRDAARRRRRSGDERARPRAAATSTRTAQPVHPTAPELGAPLPQPRRRRLGRPVQREPERVKRDVRDGYVTIEGAARDYGVVVVGDPEAGPGGPVVDEEGRRACGPGR